MPDRTEPPKETARCRLAKWVARSVCGPKRLSEVQFSVLAESLIMTGGKVTEWQGLVFGLRVFRADAFGSVLSIP